MEDTIQERLKVFLDILLYFLLIIKECYLLRSLKYICNYLYKQKKGRHDIKYCLDNLNKYLWQILNLILF